MVNKKYTASLSKDDAKVLLLPDLAKFKSGNLNVAKVLIFRKM